MLWKVSPTFPGYFFYLNVCFTFEHCYPCVCQLHACFLCSAELALHFFFLRSRIFDLFSGDMKLFGDINSFVF